MKIFLVLICLSSWKLAQCFLLGPANLTLSYTRRNLTCPLGRIDTLNGTTSGTVDYNNTGFDYCVIYEETLPGFGGPSIRSTFSWIERVNDYRFVATSRCGFSSSCDIGYGSCTLYPYDYASLRTLCICSTSNCSSSMVRCQASVNQSMSSPPPLLPAVIPTLTNRISCADGYYNLSVSSNIVPPMYNGCFFRNPSFTLNDTACHLSAPTITVLCFIMYHPAIGTAMQIAHLEDSYMTYLRAIPLYASTVNSYVIYEGISNIILIGMSNGTYDLTFCFCTTNYCNNDFATCSNGINYPQLWPNVNRSNISSTISSSSSTMATSTLSTLTTRLISNSSNSTRTTSTRSGSSHIRWCVQMIIPLFIIAIY